METDFPILAPSYLARLVMFRGMFLEIRNLWARRANVHLNVIELAVLVTRGGRRLPFWIRSIKADSAAREFPLHELTESRLHSYFHEIEDQLSIHRVVPKTKRNLFASYLAGQVCATADSLVGFAGVAHSTAHKWLHRCTEFHLLEIFQTEHEIFYVQPALIQLILVGNTEKQHLARYELADDLAELRRRSRRWLQTSPLTQKLERDAREIPLGWQHPSKR